jgi:NADH-quinone oxidoreductase subunit L
VETVAAAETVGGALLQRPHEIVPFLILLLPLAGFIVLSLLGDAIRRDKDSRGAGILACATVIGSFGLSVWSVISLRALMPGMSGLNFTQPYLGFEWIEAGGFRVPMSLLLDPLSSVMILVVTGVGSLIHVYSLGYMAHDEEQVRYFSYLNLFTFFMLLLVLGGNLPVMFVGWEGVGLCSYLLIGFWFKKPSAARAGMKAFVVNRVGDVGLILGMVLAWHAFGTVDLVDLADNAGSLAREPLGQFGIATTVCLLLFVGATGKSAQIPLHVWLPDAMEGPTPVSALIHAATMVTAGVYMVARLAPLYSRSDTAMMVIAVIGAATAFMAGTIALVQTDIKRVLAYSTVSQLGFMFLAAGVGAFGVAVFHLFTHAFFKALLFLGSGSVIHALDGEQDMRRMGGLWRKIPWTFVTFLVGTLAIAGIPPLAGYFSKDAILAAALDAHRTGLFVVALFTALLTAFYMGRLLVLTFFGEYRGGVTPATEAARHGHVAPDHEAPPVSATSDPHHDAHGGHGHAGGIHEAPWSMRLPLLLLAIGSAAVGLINIPRILQPVFRLPAGEQHQGLLVPVLATAAAVIGLVAAYYLYTMYGDLTARLAESARSVRRVLEEKYGFDRLYDWLAGRVVVEGSRGVLWQWLDAGLIDGAVNGAGYAVAAAARGVRLAQTGFVRAYVLLMLGGAVVLLGYLVWMR